MTSATRGRPPVYSGPLIAVSFDGVGAAWCAGRFFGDPTIVMNAEVSAEARETVIVYGAELTAGRDTPTAALAALASWDPGRVYLTTIPDDVWALISEPGCGHTDV